VTESGVLVAGANGQLGSAIVRRLVAVSVPVRAVGRKAAFSMARVQAACYSQPEFPDADWKPMTTVGPGVREIRIQTEVAHRRATRVSLMTALRYE
jgi:uncharacterized protein YbjT (DUF2867 family)